MTNRNLVPRIEYDDLRGWLAMAESLDELRTVDGANWQEEIGMAAELVSHEEEAPAVLFDRIPGCPDGHRVVVNMFGGRRMRTMLGFPADLTKIELSECLFDSFSAAADGIPYEMVDDGPVLENVLTGDDVDLSLFPAPQWHEGDGGRYIGTGCFNVSRPPDSDWINLGCYRIMVKGRNTVSYNAAPGKHGRVHHEAWAARGEKMPVAMVVGGDPLLFVMGGSEAPDGTCEYDMVGGLRGRPVKVVRGPITGLPIPASAEIVLEGWVDPTQMVPEGPFGDWTGTYTESGRVRPLVEIAGICHRNDPIILGCPPQRPPDEYVGHVAAEPERCRRAGYRVGLVSRSRRRPPADRRIDHPALSGPCPPGGADRSVLPAWRLCVKMDCRRRRRYRCVRSQPAHVGLADSGGPGGLDRFFQERLDVAGRSNGNASGTGRWRSHQQPRYCRCMPTLSLEGRISPT